MSASGVAGVMSWYMTRIRRQAVAPGLRIPGAGKSQRAGQQRGAGMGVEGGDHAHAGTLDQVTGARSSWPGIGYQACTMVTPSKTLR